MMFEGTGTFDRFVARCNKAIEALKNGVILLPQSDGAQNAKFAIEGKRESSKLVLDLQDAPVFSLNNVRWNVTVSGTITRQTVSVEGNFLIIRFGIVT